MACDLIAGTLSYKKTSICNEIFYDWSGNRWNSFTFIRIFIISTIILQISISNSASGLIRSNNFDINWQIRLRTIGEGTS